MSMMGLKMDLYRAQPDYIFQCKSSLPLPPFHPFIGLVNNYFFFNLIILEIGSENGMEGAGISTARFP